MVAVVAAAVVVAVSVVGAVAAVGSGANGSEICGSEVTPESAARLSVCNHAMKSKQER